MAERQLDSGEIAFQTEGRLLQELGERLVASPEVALVELIKNSYDADATSCEVALVENEKTLEIRDDGLGMSFSQFSERWMRIATSHKVHERASPKFRRHLTGQKGIGRFAVRFLGRSLHLESVARDDARKCLTRLVADFDWTELDKEEDLQSARIPYRLLRVAAGTPTGTVLSIRALKGGTAFAKTTGFRTAVLRIISPLAGLDGGRLRPSTSDSTKDPGFRVTLPGDPKSTQGDLDLAKELLDHAWARLSIELSHDSVSYQVKFHNEEKPERLKAAFDSSIRNGVIADIRYFPRRAGVFRDTAVNGQEAWRWVRDSAGVAVVDHGFRLPPYGYPDDDWLSLNIDGAHNERNWRSSISERRFPIPEEIRGRSENPMLNLATNFQLVGAVFVESTAIGTRSDEDLITSMDREGFLSNEAFDQLVDVVRGGIEFLAHHDRLSMQREAERKAKQAARETRADLKAAVQYIEQSPTLTRSDKTRLVQEYSGLARQLGEVDEYNREARRKLETMSALGVVAGFMTHETSRILASLADALRELKLLARKHPSLKQNATAIEQSYKALQGHLEYTSTFIQATQTGAATAFKAAGQVRIIIERFGDFATARNITVSSEIDSSVEAPKMPVTTYSGILLNLYTNALKAILARPRPSGEQRIVFRAANDDKWHIVEVLDTGVGIPPNLRDRIWDPLFTTTSRLNNNPLGSGMGLGLTLVKDLVEQVDGRVALVDAPEGFSTCFRVQFPRSR